MFTLEGITRDNIHDIPTLAVAEHQKPTCPRSNAYSIAEGFFPSDDDPVWMKAICNDGVPAGFMMTSEATESGADYFWRLMIDARYQGEGYGAVAAAGSEMDGQFGGIVGTGGIP